MNSIYLWIKQHAGAIAGTLVTVASVTAATVTLVPFDGSSASVTYEILETIDVLDVRTPLQGLNITFQGADLEQENLNLRIYAMRIRNTGDVDVLQNHFDDKIPWGLKIDNGKVIEARLTGASTEYLEDRSSLQIVNEDFVQFEKLIFENNHFFTFTILVLHTKGLSPNLIPTGKIAGIDRIRIVPQPIQDTGSGFFASVFSGGWKVQIVRLLSIPVGGLAILVFVIVSMIWLSGLPEKHRRASREQNADHLRSLQKIGDSNSRDGLKKEYVNNGASGLRRLKNQLDFPATIEQRLRDPQTGLPDMEDLEDAFIFSNRYWSPSHWVDYLADIGAIKRPRRRKISVTPEFMAALDDVLNELIEKGEN